MFHQPVLLQEVLEYLDPRPGQNFIDGTLGGGGYSLALLKRTAPDGKVLSIDLDETAIQAYSLQLAEQDTKDRAVVVHGNFRDLAKIVERHKFSNIAGITLDLGLSSFQLDESGRGISFQKHEPLDMRFNVADPGPDAKFILNTYDEHQLAEIFRNYGEEPEAWRIAKAIVRGRSQKLFHYTTDLTEVIKQALPKPKQHKNLDANRRIFQALRLAVNHELENLERFLPQALDLLNPGGRLVIVSFHSLEDRIVKQFFLAASRGCICPPEFPECRCGRNPQAMVLTRKPVIPSVAETENNPRSKSAKLRALKKRLAVSG